MNSSKQYHIVYKTTNLVNGKYYIGVHKCCSLKFDRYLGSGIVLKNAVEKYGKENFTREILFVFNTSKEAYAKEKEIVNMECVNNENTYNLKIGGLGGSEFGRIHSKETKAKISASLKGKLLGENNHMYGRHLSNETRTKISNSHKGTPLSEEHKKSISDTNKGKLASEKTKAKMRNSHKGIKHPVTICPHCNKSGGARHMKRWHFDNCKSFISSKSSVIQ